MSTTPEDAFRIQLEGRLEVIERARVLQATLLRRLGGPGWQRRLRGQPGLLAAVREHEPVLVEALERVERRARQELWPEEQRHLPEAEAPLRAGGGAVLGVGGTSRGTRPSG